MSHSSMAPGARISPSAGRRFLPDSTVGWCALAFSFVGLAAWVALPLITMAYRDTYPVTDTAVMPAIGVVLVDVAAVYDLLSVFRWKERSVLVVAATVVTVAAAVFFTFIVVAGGLSGV